jgi:two-component system sensor histidine kinase DesK
MLTSLIFLIAPALDFVDHTDGLRMAGGLVLIAAFFGLYSYVMIGRKSDEDQDLAGVAGLIALAVALVAVGGTDWAGLWCFVAAAAGLRVDRHLAIPGLLVLGGAAALTEGLNAWKADAMLSLFIVTLGVGLFTGGFRRLRKVNLELGRARGEIGRLAVADERLRFARDLHDLLGHSLSVVALKSELAGKLIADHPDQAAAQVQDIEAVSRRALAEVRDAVAGYRRPVLRVARVRGRMDAAPAADGGFRLAVTVPLEGAA